MQDSHLLYSFQILQVQIEELQNSVVEQARGILTKKLLRI